MVTGGETGRPGLRVSDVATASGYSVQQVRDLERLGVLPPARRESKGYRVFGEEHVLGAKVYRALSSAIGPVGARRALRELRQGSMVDAAAAVAGFHRQLLGERESTLAALAALHSIGGEGGDEGEHMSIGTLAAALGVRPSTLRFWEGAGLVRPERVGSIGARRYGPSAIREARIVAALRSAGYRVPAVSEAIGHLRSAGAPREGRAGPDPGAALDARLDDLSRRMITLMEAGALLAALLRGLGQRNPGAENVRRSGAGAP